MIEFAGTQKLSKLLLSPLLKVTRGLYQCVAAAVEPPRGTITYLPITLSPGADGKQIEKCAPCTGTDLRPNDHPLAILVLCAAA